MTNVVMENTHIERNLGWGKQFAFDLPMKAFAFSNVVFDFESASSAHSIRGFAFASFSNPIEMFIAIS